MMNIQRAINNNRNGFKLILTAVGLMWLIQIINMLINYQLNQFGVIPRQFSHLTGILFMPFLHGGIGHIVSNTIPFIILGFLVHQTRKLLFVSSVVILLSGLLIWLFGRHSIHIGASGLVMGYFGFLISHAFFTRSLRSMLISIITVLFYGGMVITLFDFRSHISFEGHFAGFMSGITCAWYLGKSHKNGRY